MVRVVRGGVPVLGALLALFVAAAGAATSGWYDESTSQALHLWVELNAGEIDAVYYGADYTGAAACRRADSPIAEELNPNHGLRPFAIHGSSFSTTITIAREDTLRIQGAFKGKKLGGSFDETFTEEGVTCTTGKVRFSGKLGSPPA